MVTWNAIPIQEFQERIRQAARKDDMTRRGILGAYHEDELWERAAREFEQRLETKLFNVPTARLAHIIEQIWECFSDHEAVIAYIAEELDIPTPQEIFDRLIEEEGPVAEEEVEP